LIQGARLADPQKRPRRGQEDYVLTTLGEPNPTKNCVRQRKRGGRKDH